MKKKKTKKWIKFRHKVVFFLLRPLFCLFLKKRYKLKVNKEEKKVPAPSIIMCNHQCTLDPFFLCFSLRRPVYFVMSEDLFTLGFISKVLVWLLAPISKSKSKSDINTVRQTLKVLGEGGTVCIYPSGNRSLSGKEWDIDISAAKLVKMAKVPLVLYNLKGGYGADPRWGKGVRKGKTEIGVNKIITAEQIKEMSAEELHAEIVNALDVDDASLNVNFKSKHRAEYLERALYYCPQCKSFNTLTSNGVEFGCTNCDFKAEYGEDLTFKRISGELPYKTVREWFDVQKQALFSEVKNTDTDLFSDQNVLARTIIKFKRDKNQTASITANKDGVVVLTENGNRYDVKFSEIYGATILGKKKINFYLPNDIVLQVKGDERFCSVKYLHLYEAHKTEDKND